MADEVGVGVSGNPACNRWQNYHDVAEVLGDVVMDDRDYAHLAADGRPVPSVARDLPIRDPDMLRAALLHGDSRVLLMVLVQLTRDANLLDTFAPLIRPVFEGGNQISAEQAQTIRDALFNVLTGPAIQESPLPTALMQQMMSVCVGETVGKEFLPLLLEQAGFTREQAVEVDSRSSADPDFHVVIVGGGMSGIAAAIKLGQAGYNYTLFDRNEEVGGTWWENVYPGVAVDTPSHFYSYSFEINPAWPRYFSTGDVLEDYLVHCARKYGVRDHVMFRREVLSCVYDEKSGKWAVTTRDQNGMEHVAIADAVIPALGHLNRPAYPEIPGLDSFKGPMPHTARWDKSIDLADKKVAIIGVGASAMQVGPAIVDQVDHLTIFQRSPHWVIPNPSLNASVPEESIWCQSHIPYYAQWLRFLTYWNASDGGYAVVRIDPNWPDQDISTSAANHARRELLLWHLKKELDGRPDLIEKMTPDFPVGGKRIIQDNNWFKLMRRQEVSLENCGIDHVEPDAIVTKDGRRIDVDVIILATGFKLSPMLYPITITGKGGQELHEQWGEEDPRAYLGMTVPNFPNLFVMAGPNAAPNHGAGVNLVAECQANYIVGCLDLLSKTGSDTIEVKEQVHDEYNNAVDAEMEHMVWTHPKASNYYQNSKRRIYISCPWRLVDMWWLTRTPRPEDFILSTVVPDAKGMPALHDAAQPFC